MAIFTQDLTTWYFHLTDSAAILDFCELRKMLQWDFLGLWTLRKCMVAKKILLQFCHIFVKKYSD